MSRLFTKRQKQAVELVTGAAGQGDHIVPHSKGGETSVENCQLISKAANLKKGDFFFKPRRWQEEFYKQWMARTINTFLLIVIPGGGWGEDPSKVEAVIRDDPEALAAFREAMLGKPGRPTSETGNNVTELDTGVTGNSRAYSISRVQRECDAETVAAVMAGEMSPNAALVKAGVRENRQVYIPRDPAMAVEKLRHQFGEDFIEGIRRALHGR